MEGPEDIAGAIDQVDLATLDDGDGFAGRHRAEGRASLGLVVPGGLCGHAAHYSSTGRIVSQERCRTTPRRAAASRWRGPPTSFSRSAGVRKTVHRRKIRFDVDERRAVDAVDVAHHKRGAVDFDKFDGRQCDGIGPYR